MWLTEDCSHRETREIWRQLENPLSHFLVSFVLQEVLFGSEIVAAARGADKARESGAARRAGVDQRRVHVGH